MANIKFSQFTTTSPSDTVSLVGYLSTDNVKFTIADLKTQFNNSYVTLNTTQSITSTKQFTTFPILGDQAYTASYGSEVKLYSFHNAESSWIFNSVGVYDKIFSFRVNDLRRWAFSANQDAETGSTAGTNFEIRRYNDAGTFIDSPISITRSDGTVAFGGNIQLLGSMQLGDGVTLSNSELQALDGVSTGETIQEQLNGMRKVVFTSGALNSAVTSTSSTNLIPSTTFTIANSSMQIGSTIELYVYSERTSGTGNTYLGISCNGIVRNSAIGLSTTTSSTYSHFIIFRETATELRIGYTSSGSTPTATSMQPHASSSVLVAADGSGNFNFQLTGYVAGTTTMTIRNMRAFLTY